jgi:hypothetical protein
MLAGMKHLMKNCSEASRGEQENTKLHVDMFGLLALKPAHHPSPTSIVTCEG